MFAWTMTHKGNRLLTSAHTKSEARAHFKAMLNVPRLPAGVRVEKQAATVK